jgi:hypothetical protein
MFNRVVVSRDPALGFAVGKQRSHYLAGLRTFRASVPSRSFASNQTSGVRGGASTATV